MQVNNNLNFIKNNKLKSNNFKLYLDNFKKNKNFDIKSTVNNLINDHTNIIKKIEKSLNKNNYREKYTTFRNRYKIGENVSSFCSKYVIWDCLIVEGKCGD